MRETRTHRFCSSDCFRKILKAILGGSACPFSPYERRKKWCKPKSFFRFRDEDLWLFHSAAAL